MADQSSIQFRYIDPYEKINSDLTNHLIMVVYPDGKGIVSGFTLSVNTNNPLALDVTSGVVVKDYVVIEYKQNFTITFETQTVADGFYLVVLEYFYDKLQPPPTATVKFIKPTDYDPTLHLILGTVHVVNGQIVSISDDYPDPTLGLNRPKSRSNDHNSLQGLQGGDPNLNEFYHLTAQEYNTIHNILDDGILSHNELNNIQGGAPNEYYHLPQWAYDDTMKILQGQKKVPFADKLDGHPASDFALVGHTHQHNTLTNLQGGDPTNDEFYHLSQSDYDKFLGLISGGITVDNAEHLQGHPASDFAMASHNHQHNSLLNIQGGDPANDDCYHLTWDEYNKVMDVVNGNFQASDADTLDGYHASDFALVNHNHNHNDLDNIQGGNANERYHLTNDEINYVRGLMNGTVTVANSDKLDGYDSSYFAPATHTHDHNTLTNIQGGAVNEYYHVDKNVYDALTNANNPNQSNPFVTIADINNIRHNSLDELQGGDHTADEFYHLNKSQHDILTGGPTSDASTLHNHNSLYYTKAETDSMYLRTDGGNALTADLNMGGNRVVNVADPVNPQDAVTKNYVDNWTPSNFEHNDLNGIQGGISGQYYHLTENEHFLLTQGQEASDLHNHDQRYYTKPQADTTFLSINGGTMNGSIDMNDHYISNVKYPVNDSDAATKKYVDDVLSDDGIPSGAIILAEDTFNHPAYTALNLQDSCGLWLYKKN